MADEPHMAQDPREPPATTRPDDGAEEVEEEIPRIVMIIIIAIAVIVAILFLTLGGGHGHFH